MKGPISKRDLILFKAECHRIDKDRETRLRLARLLREQRIGEKENELLWACIKVADMFGVNILGHQILKAQRSAFADVDKFKKPK